MNLLTLWILRLVDWVDAKTDRLWPKQAMVDQDTIDGANRQIERQLLERIADAGGDGD